MSIQTLSDFLAAFFPDEHEPIHLRVFAPKKAPSDDTRFTARRIIASRHALASDVVMQEQLRHLNATRGLYFVVNAGGETDAEITRFNAWFVEDDSRSIDEQHRRLDAAPLAPSIRLETRQSVHAYWLIAGECSAEEWRGIQQKLIAYFGGDEKIKNPSRVMRLPFFNHVHYDKETGLLSFKRVALIEFAREHRYTLTEMQTAFAAAREPDLKPEALAYSISQSAHEFASWDELHAEATRRICLSSKARTDSKGWTHAPGSCHGSTDGTALYVSPAGAYGCLKKCTTTAIRAIYGLPERPNTLEPETNIGSKAGVAETESAPPVAWPVLSDSALYGLAGEIVHTIDPHTEADRAAVLIQTLVAFGNCIGRTAHFTAEADRHYLNLFTVLIGATSKGRKGTSWGQVRRLFEHIDEQWAANCVGGGLSSGEGLIWSVRDTLEKKEPVKEKGRIVDYQIAIADEGVADKRTLIQESEFSSVLRVMAREGNTLSATIRQAWDTGNLQVKTRNSPNRATGAHISIIGHITKEELKRNLDETETANGFANRFLWVCVRRSGYLPEGGALSDSELNPLVIRLREALYFARDVREMQRDAKASTLWNQIYTELSEGHMGLFGAVTSRAEAQTMRLACLYALLDRKAVVERVHLQAGLALWLYCESSARYIFGNATGDRIADELLSALRDAGSEGLTRTQIRDLFNRRRSGAIDTALTVLAETGRAHFEQVSTGGRPVTCWFAAIGSDKSDKST
jgi:hypothetical protein